MLKIIIFLRVFNALQSLDKKMRLLSNIGTATFIDLKSGITLEQVICRCLWFLWLRIWAHIVVGY